MARAAENYSDGRALGFDRIAGHFTPELACIHELERFESKVGGSDKSMMPGAQYCTRIGKRKVHHSPRR